MTCGHWNVSVAERSGRSSSSTTSAFPLKTRTWARRSEHTFSGSKLAFKTSTCCTLAGMYPTRRLSGARLESAAHRSLDRFLLLRREGDRGLAAVELLHVDPGVVAALDRRHDHARPGRVEQRERRRLVAARVLVCVIPHDRRVRDG